MKKAGDFALGMRLAASSIKIGLLTGLDLAIIEIRSLDQDRTYSPEYIMDRLLALKASVENDL